MASCSLLRGAPDDDCRDLIEANRGVEEFHAGQLGQRYGVAADFRDNAFDVLSREQLQLHTFARVLLDGLTHAVGVVQVDLSVLRHAVRDQTGASDGEAKRDDSRARAASADESQPVSLLFGQQGITSIASRVRASVLIAHAHAHAAIAVRCCSEGGLVNAGTRLSFDAAKGRNPAYLLFLIATDSGQFEPLSGHTFPTETVFRLTPATEPR
jgi:hypothetical protein